MVPNQILGTSAVGDATNSSLMSRHSCGFSVIGDYLVTLTEAFVSDYADRALSAGTGFLHNVVHRNDSCWSKSFI